MAFENRAQAGRELARQLTSYANRDDVIVIGIPRGGVPVAFEIATALALPLDVFVLRKLGVPGREELAFGAIANGNVRILNRDIIEGLSLTGHDIERVTQAEKRELVRRERLYRGARAPLDVRGRTVILVDDGIATGASVKAAIRALRQMNPAALVLAMPVTPPSVCNRLRPEVDELVCLETPEPFYGVGQFYEDFSQVSDDEVQRYLSAASQEPKSRNAAGNTLDRYVQLAVLLFFITLGVPAQSMPRKLHDETLAAWNEYVQLVCSRTENHAHQVPFLWITELPPRSAEVHAGEIAVWNQRNDGSFSVPHGLIHDWLGAVFIPHSSISNVLSVIRNYGRYAEIYNPAVIQAQALPSYKLDDRFSMIVLHKELFVTAAVRGEYETRYVQIDENHWYSISRSTRLQAIQNVNTPEMHVLPPDEGPGYIWRLLSVTKFEQSDDGVYVEMEALALSRDVPLMWRWLVDPIIAKLGKNSVHTTLEQTRKAVLLGHNQPHTISPKSSITD